MTTFGGFTRYFGDELRRHRDRMGWTRADLAERMPWSAWTIKSIERGQRKPPPGFGEHCDALFGLPGDMTALAKEAQEDDSPFGDFRDLEHRATSIRIFDARLVPGLLQTEGYARTIQRMRRPSPADAEVERLVQVRLARQQILQREEPPTMHAVLDEAVIARRIGTPEVMHQQLATLLTPSRNVTLQVLLLSAGAHDCADGPLTVLRLPNEPDIAYADGWAGGHLLDTPAEVFRAQQSFEQLAALALPPEMSLATIATYMEKL